MARGRGRGRGRGNRGRGSSRGGFKNHHGPGRKPNESSRRGQSTKNDSGRGGSKRPHQDRQQREEDEANKRQKMEEAALAESSSSSESEEEVKPYNQLLSLFKAAPRAEQAITSEEESESDSEEGEDEETEGDDLKEESHLEEEEEEEEVEDAIAAQEEEEEDESESEPVEEQEDETDGDTFHLHFERELSDGLLSVLTSPKPYESKELHWKALGRMTVHLPAVSQELGSISKKPPTLLGEPVQEFVSPGTAPVLRPPSSNLKDWGVRAQLCANLDKRPLADGSTQLAEDLLTPLQLELFGLAHEYRDVYMPEVSLARLDEVRTVYCLHALNHVLKSRDKVLQHNSKLSSQSKSGTESSSEAEFRDQGLVRPRVLIMTPFKNSAVRIVDKLGSILLPKKGQVINRPRFQEEFGGGEEEAEAKKEPSESRKPEDYVQMFSGNTDDSFRLGVSVAKRSLRLYASFYMSDILVASPLGLRTLLAEDFDFLCSVEVLVLDQADVLYMQNWDHVLHVFQHLHLQPREQHGTDLGRVRLWALNGHSAHYRQNLIFSSVALPEAAALFSRRGTNFAGKVRVENLVTAESAAVCRVAVQLPQTFHRFQTESSASAAEDRFQFFVKKILPQFRGDALMSNTLVFVPSYYDYVRLRNYFHKEEVNFGQACEYTPEGKLAQVRNRFFLGRKRLLLYTERLHFYRRLTVKGIHHIVFYQLPAYPHFYAELCNLLQDCYQSKKYRGDSSQTCTVLYSTFDAPRLAGVVGSQRAAEMLGSDRPAHLFVSGAS